MRCDRSAETSVKDTHTHTPGKDTNVMKHARILTSLQVFKSLNLEICRHSSVQFKTHVFVRGGSFISYTSLVMKSVGFWFSVSVKDCGLRRLKILFSDIKYVGYSPGWNYKAPTCL